jgi:hypothetical protein
MLNVSSLIDGFTGKDILALNDLPDLRVFSQKVKTV